MPVRVSLLGILVGLAVVGEGAAAAPDGADIARAVDRVNRFATVRNVHYGERDRPVVVLDLSAGGRLTVNTFERWRTNEAGQAEIAARDLAIFRSGKLRGTGILVTDFAGEGAGRAYAMWLPSLRKIRRFAEPDPADYWGNSNFSFGDIYIRGPDDEHHEVLGTEAFQGCLGAVELPEPLHRRHTRGIPQPDCSVDGRQVYRLRSRPHRSDLGYEERVVWVDAQTHVDYRSDYYRAGERVKRIDKSWRSMGTDDPQAQYWVYWYAHSPMSGQQGMAFVAPDAVAWDQPHDPALWSERTLRQIHR